MGPETSFWPQRAVKEALALPTARKLVRGHTVEAGIGLRLPGGDGLRHKLGSTESGLEATRGSKSACMWSVVSTWSLGAQWILRSTSSDRYHRTTRGHTLACVH